MTQIQTPPTTDGSQQQAAQPTENDNADVLTAVAAVMDLLQTTNEKLDTIAKTQSDIVDKISRLQMVMV